MLLKLFKGQKFFTISTELTNQLQRRVEEMRAKDLERIEADPEQTERIENEEFEMLPFFPDSLEASYQSRDEVSAFRRFVASELYHHLAFLSRGERCKKRQPIPIKEAVSSSMKNALGLSPDDVLLTKLIEEFTAWIKENGEFGTGWGKIFLAENDSLYLEASVPKERSVAASTSEFFVPRPLKHQKRLKSRSKGGSGQ